LNLGRRGARLTSGLPGTGISYNQKLGSASPQPGLSAAEIILAVIGGLVIVFFAMAFL